MPPLVFTTDKARLLEHFQKDPVLFGYHLGDLDDFYFDHCQWGVTYAYLPTIEDVILVYTGGKLPTVLAFGLTDDFPNLLREMLDLLPDKFYCHFQERSRHVLQERYCESSLGTHQKMKLAAFTPARLSMPDNAVQRLNRSHTKALVEFYDRCYPGHYFHERMLDSEKYFGYFENDNLLTTAGVHVYSKEYNIAVLGNVATHPDYRGRGLASAVTSVLTQELVNEGRLIALNVKTDNTAAIRSYQNLGFVVVCEYEEALFESRQ